MPKRSITAQLTQAWTFNVWNAFESFGRPGAIWPCCVDLTFVPALVLALMWWEVDRRNREPRPWMFWVTVWYVPASFYWGSPSRWASPWTRSRYHSRSLLHHFQRHRLGLSRWAPPYRVDSGQASHWWHHYPSTRGSTSISSDQAFAAARPDKAQATPLTSP